MLDTCWLMAALLALLSVPLYFGKGAWLLAGYNRNQDHRREGMDEKLLCRIMAVILDTAAAVFFVGGLGFITLPPPSWPWWWCWAAPSLPTGRPGRTDRRDFS